MSKLIWKYRQITQQSSCFSVKYQEPAFIFCLWNEMNVPGDLQQLKVRLAPPIGGYCHSKMASLILPQALLPKPHQCAPPRLHFDWWWCKRQRKTQEARRSVPCGTLLSLPRSFHSGNESGEVSCSYLCGLSKTIQTASSMTSSSLHKHKVNHQRAFFSFFLLSFVLDVVALEVSGIPGDRSSSTQTLLVNGKVHVQMLLQSQTDTWQEVSSVKWQLVFYYLHQGGFVRAGDYLW